MFKDRFASNIYHLVHPICLQIHIKYLTDFFFHRFNLEYVDEKGEKKRPVIVHRAILGSVERMIAVLTESFAGKWPFWLSPRQCMVVPVAPPFNEYAEKVQKMLKAEGYMIDVNVDNSDTMNKKVRNAQIAQYNFIFGESNTFFKDL